MFQTSLSITKDDAIKYAYEKLDTISKDFCWISDVCVHFSHAIGNLKNIQFHGYGIIESIEWEPNSNPIWKRINIYIKSFSFFPPIILEPISMQVHHLIQGWYEDTERTRKIYLTPINRIQEIIEPEKKRQESIEQINDDKIKKICDPKILKFKPKRQ